MVLKLQDDLPGQVEGEQVSLVLDELRLYEINAIGHSIVGHPYPDLTMFLPDMKEAILVSAVNHLRDLIGRSQPDVQASLAPYVAPLLKSLSGLNKIEGSCHYSHLEYDILQAFEESRPKITVLLSLGKQEEARKAAVCSLDSSNLETVLGNYELAEGRALSADEVRAVSEKYLLKNKGLNKVGQIIKVYQDRGIEPVLNNMPQIIDAVLDDVELGSTILSRFSTEQGSRETYADYQKAVRGIVSGFGIEKTKYLSLIRQYLEKRKLFTASLLGNLFLEQYGSDIDASLKGDLETLAQEFVNQGNLIVGKKIMEKIGIPFNYDTAYADFIKEATSPKKTNELSILLGAFGLPNMAHVLLQADDGTLRKFAAESAKLVHGKHAELMETHEIYTTTGWSFVYQFAIAANKNIGNTQEVEKLTPYLEGISVKIKSMHSQPKISKTESQSPSKKAEPRDLGEMLLSDSAYIKAAWKAYEQDGLFGIRDTTQQWVSRYKADDIGRPYTANPIEILAKLFEMKGLPLDNFFGNNPNMNQLQVVRARQAIVEYMLRTGNFSRGIGAQAYRDFREGNLMITTERFAMCIVTCEGTESIPFPAGEMLKNAEMVKSRMHDSIIPEYLYRAAAAEELDNYAYRWFSALDPRNPCQPSSLNSALHSALQHYQKIGHKGLAQFIKKNFKIQE